MTYEAVATSVSVVFKAALVRRRPASEQLVVRAEHHVRVRCHDGLSVPYQHQRDDVEGVIAVARVPEQVSQPRTVLVQTSLQSRRFVVSRRITHKSGVPCPHRPHESVHHVCCPVVALVWDLR